jgi:hypothetical protein
MAVQEDRNMRRSGEGCGGRRGGRRWRRRKELRRMLEAVGVVEEWNAWAVMKLGLMF